MRFRDHSTLSKSQKKVIFAVTFGNILEWYDIYLYVFWAPTLSTLFFKQGSPSINLFNTIAFFALGFFFRPLGGLLFGRLGDHLGRKTSFILSILLMTIPTFVLGLIPTYSQIGIFAPIILAFSRVLQTFPSGGELPGVFCYLYESADCRNRKFMTSFAGVGNQIGVALSVIECFLLEKFLPEDILINWGWRISFIFGGFIGLTGLFLRYKLHETHLFQEVVDHKTPEKSLSEVIKSNWKNIMTGISYGSAQTVSFHLMSILFPIYLYKNIGIDFHQNLTYSLVLLALTTLPLPVFGLLGDKFGVRKLLICACVGIICLIYPMYEAVHAISMGYKVIISILFVMCFTCITALWPYLISNLFGTSVRYTCVGLSFNLADGVLGGLSIVASTYLFNFTGNPGSFTLILAIACFISLFSYLNIRKRFE